MAEFSYSDINEAKKRVEEMRRKAQGYVQDERREPAPEPPPLPKPSPKAGNSLSELLSGLSSNDDSALIIALILILSREKADNMLILALLYILL